MRWSEISARQPALGAVADRLLIEPRVLLAGTIRRDGTARISGVEPLVLDGDLWLSMMSGSAKSRDLGRDPPVAGQFTLFIVEVADVTYIGSGSGTGAQHVARWPSGEEYIRPQLTPTSLGAPQAVSRLLTPDS
jgi:hypothetical protein